MDNDDLNEKLSKLAQIVSDLAERMDAEHAEKTSVQEVQNERKAEEYAVLNAAKRDAENSLPQEIAQTRALKELVERKDAALGLRMKEWGPLTDADRADMAQSQARHDAVQQGFGRQAPAPMQGETPRMYRVRLMHDLRKYAVDPKLKAANFSREESATLDIFEPMLIADAQKEAQHPTDFPGGEMRKVVRKDESGRSIVEFYGPDTFVKQFAGPCWKVQKLYTAHDIAMEKAINAVRH